MKRDEIKKRVEINKRECVRTESCDLPTLTDLEMKRKQKRDREFARHLEHCYF